VQPVALSYPTRHRRKRFWLAAIAMGALIGASATAIVTHEQNDIPRHCIVTDKDGRFHRVC
jgi:hypothetical protein